jgi:TRAP transporter 4TM/12TM fusion protein
MSKPISDPINDFSGEVITSQRALIGRHHTVALVAGTVLSLFHLWSNAIGVLPELQRNAIHFGLILFLGYLQYPTGPKKDLGLPFDYGLAVLSVLTAMYLIFFEDDLHLRKEVPNTVDLIFAGVAILLLLELTRRTTGLFIPILALIFLTYALFWGGYVAGIWHFPGVSVSRMLYRMYFTPDGIFGTIATISSTFVALFVLFGAFLLKSGAGEFMMRLALSLLGRTVGGPAKMAVCASGMLGSISGSAVANTVGSGSLTIPMMKRTGFSATFAGAVEAAASTGGQLMPPIMGAGAFIMSQWTQIPYLTIVAVSIIPALLYFISVIFFVHFRARHQGLKPLEASEIPVLKDVMKEGWHFTLPLFVLVGLLMYGFTPTYAASIGTASIVVASWLNVKTRMGPRDIRDALAMGAHNLVSTGIILLCSGIVVGVVLMVGVGIKFSLLISAVAGNSLFLAIILIALSSLILGMGLPVTASYIVLAVLAGPALTHLGVGLLSAHLLIFWYSQDANVTPPVCLAAYSAAGISGANPLQTGFEAWRISKALYLIPLLFCYTPILFTGPWWQVADTSFSALIGLLAFAAASEGFHIRRLGVLIRILFYGCAGLLLWPSTLLHAVGLVLLTCLTLWQKATAGSGGATPTATG